MWDLKGNEWDQEKLDTFDKKVVFAKDDDDSLTKKTVTLASVIYRMVVLQQRTCYRYEKEKVSHRQQCSTSRLRSVDDIYLVAKNYVKKPLTRTDVERAMDKLINAGLITQQFCETVKRRVHYTRRISVSLKEIKEILKDGGKRKNKRDK